MADRVGAGSGQRCPAHGLQMHFRPQHAARQCRVGVITARIAAVLFAVQRSAGRVGVAEKGDFETRAGRRRPQLAAFDAQAMKVDRVAVEGFLEQFDMMHGTRVEAAREPVVPFAHRDLEPFPCRLAVDNHAVLFAFPAVFQAGAQRRAREPDLDRTALPMHSRRGRPAEVPASGVANMGMIGGNRERLGAGRCGDKRRGDDEAAAKSRIGR